MARINVEQIALTDARFGRLAQLMGYADADHARGKMLRVWNENTERDTYVLPAWLIDQHLGDGGAASMIAAELGEQAPPDGVRVRGTAGRTDWLGANRRNAAAGGVARAASAPRNSGRFTSATSHPAGTDHQPPGWSSSPAVASALAPDLAPALAPDTAKAPDQPLPVGAAAPPARGRKVKPMDYTPEELEAAAYVLDLLSERSSIAYRGSAKHTALLVARLRDGCTRWDLRRVVAYCADQLKWQDKPEMRPYLRPETLFGPQSIEKYLDPARTWMPGPEPTTQPRLHLLTGGTDHG